MRRSLLLAAAFVLLASIGCGKKTPTPDDSSGTGPGQGPAPRPTRPRDSIPLSEFPYNPTKPDLHIDLKKLPPSLSAKDPAAKDWLAKNGKVADVRGLLVGLLPPGKSGREVFLIQEEYGPASIPCEILFPPNWRKISPGSVVTVVGRLAAQEKGGKVELRLDDAYPMAMPTPANARTTADEVAREAAADPTGFAAKWKPPERWDYLTGTLQGIDKNQPDGDAGPTYQFTLRAGTGRLALRVLNPLAVEAAPPKPGEQVAVYVHMDGHYGGSGVFSGQAVYVGK